MSVFSEPHEFQVALQEEGVLNLLVTGPGQFRARLTQVTLHHLRLLAGEERLSRIVFAEVPEDTLFISLTADDRPGPIWDGVVLQVGEMITLGPGQRVHSRTDGLCHWAAIQLSAEELAQYAGALTGAAFIVPPVARWQPPRAALRQLRYFHQAAMRTAKAPAGVLADKEAAHGLEQQTIHALVDALSLGPIDQETETACRRRGIVARFEDLLEAEPILSLTEIAASLGVSRRMLRECCKRSLGVSPNRYRRLRGMQRAHRALRYENSDTASVSAVARRCGFRDPGRFAANYRALYGESPSTTLTRRLGRVNRILGDRA
jgi:AraC family ethanolamine operon transcriptional activator